MGHTNRNKRQGYVPTKEEIRAARLALDLSQKEAADFVYCTEETWEGWETGKRKMHPAYWELFCIKTNTTQVF